METNGTNEPIRQRRITINLSVGAYAHMEQLSQKHRRSMTDLVRLGLGTVKILLEASEHNHKVVVCTADGKALKEIVLPTP